jgi:hypothetical protein
MLRLLAKAAEVRRILAIGRGIDNGDHEPLVSKQLPRADEEVPGAPLERTIRVDLQPAVSARKQATYPSSSRQPRSSTAR